MSTETVEITSNGIRKLLNKYSPQRAIAEFVWNGFDAKGTVVNIDFDVNLAEFDTFRSITISDNGNGICFEELPMKFKKFFESEKVNSNAENNDLTKGKNGYGRLTFFKFANFAEWHCFFFF